MHEARLGLVIDVYGVGTQLMGGGRGCKSTFVRKKLKILIIHVEKKSIDSQVHTISISYTIFRKITRLHNYSIHSENKHVLYPERKQVILYTIKYAFHSLYISRY